MRNPQVFIVHCVDTEGPLYESLAATFERIKDIFDIDLEPSKDILAKLQNGELNLGGIEKEVKRVVAPELMNYNDTWDKVDNMLTEMLSMEYRNKMLDSHGNGWVYNWFCMDHVGYDLNPRRRDMGYHNIFDHYMNKITETSSYQDGLHFHYHPMSFKKMAHLCGNHYFSHSSSFFELLSRRIIDRGWFPSCYRPGFHTIRPDSLWCIDQYIPFCFANQSTDEDYHAQKDLGNGRYGDWRRAPKSWRPYHPSHYDYQIEGSCRTWIAKCLNIGTRIRVLTQLDVDQCFAEAAEKGIAILSFTNHDFRDMRTDIKNLRSMIKNSTEKYPEVRYRFCEASQAMRDCLDLNTKEQCELKVELDDNILRIESRHKIFGPQPFLAIKTKSNQYFHDNLDIHQPFQRWSYTFDMNNFRIDEIEAVGLGACDYSGNSTTNVLNVAKNKIKAS